MKHGTGIALVVATALTGLGVAGPVVIEAEDALEIEAPMVRVDAASPPPGVVAVEGASGDAYLALPQGAGNPPEVTTGKAVYRILLPQAGTYTLWLRAYWDDSCGNSVDVKVNDRPTFTMQDSTYKSWHWVRSPPRLRQLALPEGPMTLTLVNREDGIRIDQILLTPARRYVPMGAEPATPEFLLPQETL